MSEMYRPSWCQELTCACLTSYDERICVGRLAEKRLHDDDGDGRADAGELFNTHHLCLGEDILLEINDADAFYLGQCLAAVRQDVERHGLYHEGRGVVYDLKGGKP